MRILGIDYGEKRVGLAVSDESLTLARELDILSPKDFFHRLPEIVSQNEVEQIVLGWPLNMNGEMTEKTREVEKFKEKLAASTGLEIQTWDERFSSQHASRLSGRKTELDSLAAQILLQNFLDSHKNHASEN